jgi:hypothetical protein
MCPARRSINGVATQERARPIAVCLWTSMQPYGFPREDIRVHHVSHCGLRCLR